MPRLTQSENDRRDSNQHTSRYSFDNPPTSSLSGQGQPQSSVTQPTPEEPSTAVPHDHQRPGDVLQGTQKIHRVSLSNKPLSLLGKLNAAERDSDVARRKSKMRAVSTDSKIANGRISR